MEQHTTNYSSNTEAAINIVEADGFALTGEAIAKATKDGKEIRIVSFASTLPTSVNILVADGFQIKGGTDVALTGTSAHGTVEKHAYVAVARSSQAQDDNAKELIRQYNSMRAKLLEVGLMEQKS
jgi:hypothetical protein